MHKILVLKVYKVDNASDLSESYYVNPDNFEDVTDSVNITFQIQINIK